MPELTQNVHPYESMGRVRRQPIATRNLQELQQSLIHISQAFIRNYVLSMRKRCLQVMGGRGGHTRNKLDRQNISLCFVNVIVDYKETFENWRHYVSLLILLMQ